MNAWTLLAEITEAYRTILKDALVGVYAHGSLAFGCFQENISDIDFLVVARETPTDAQKSALLQVLLDRDADAPGKGFEMSVVLAADCAKPAHPIPFCLHFSNAHKQNVRQDMAGYIGWMKGTDPDLAAHFTVTRAVGKTVWGTPIAEVFAPVPREAYLDSIKADVASAPEDVAENPVYVILNLCRVLAYQQDGAVLSKAQGGAWGLDHLPQEHHPVIHAALEAYQAGITCAADGRAFAAWAVSQL